MGISTVGKYRIEFLDKEEFNIIFNEIFIDGIYIPKLTNETKSPKILDIGSHIGLSILYFKSIFPESHIIGYEPNPILFDILKRNMERNNIGDVELKNSVVSDKDGISLFYYSSDTNWFSTGSIYQEQWKGKQKRISKSLNSIDIEKITKENGVTDILKLDIEGHEHQLIERICKHSKKITNLIIEIHPTDQKTMEDTILMIKSAYSDITYIQNEKVVKSPKLNNIFIINASN